MMTCEEATRLVSESHDRRLGLGERIGLRLHLFICEACARFARQVAFLRRAVRRLGAAAEPPAPGLPDAARRRIAGALRAERHD